VSDKYAFIAVEYAGNQADESADAPTLIQMLAWLGVSKSGFYEWRDREPSATATRREQLKEKIAALFKQYGGTYGYRRLHVELLRAGEQVGEELVRDLMRELGLVTVQP
jgi:putative transposase